jgi:hypothetical protein
MPLANYRNPVRPARGTKAALENLANQSGFRQWELLYATDEDRLYVWTGTALEPAAVSVQDLAALTLGELANVTTTAAVDGSVLTYRADTQEFVADNIDTRITITDGGNW